MGEQQPVSRDARGWKVLEVAGPQHVRAREQGAGQDVAASWIEQCGARARRPIPLTAGPRQGPLHQRACWPTRPVPRQTSASCTALRGPVSSAGRNTARWRRRTLWRQGPSKIVQVHRVGFLHYRNRNGHPPRPLVPEHQHDLQGNASMPTQRTERNLPVSRNRGTRNGRLMTQQPGGIDGGAAPVGCPATLPIVNTTPARPRSPMVSCSATMDVSRARMGSRDKMITVSLALTRR